MLHINQKLHEGRYVPIGITTKRHEGFSPIFNLGLSEHLQWEGILDCAIIQIDSSV